MERHVGKAFVLEGLLISCNVIKDVIGLIRVIGKKVCPF